MAEASYKNLLAWQLSDELAHAIYDFTASFPKDEQYGLTSQIRRAALSVPANIVEGYARTSTNEFHRFLSIALGSLSEVEYYIGFALKRNYFTEKQALDLNNIRERCGSLLWKLFQSQSRRQETRNK